MNRRLLPWFGRPMGAAVLDRVEELLQEITETADEIRAKAATLQDETPPEGIKPDGGA